MVLFFLSLICLKNFTLCDLFLGDINIHIPKYSPNDEFLVKYRFLANNYIEMKMCQTSAQAMAKALETVPAAKFRTYCNNFISRIKQVDKTGSGGILQSDKNNVVDVILDGASDFERVSTHFSSGDSRKFYVESYRSHKFSDLRNPFVVK